MAGVVKSFEKRGNFAPMKTTHNLFKFFVCLSCLFLERDSALVNIPVNISRIAPHQLNQPPWLVW